MHLLPSPPSVPSSLPSLLTAKSIAVGVVVVAILAGGAAEAAGLLGASAGAGASSATMLEATLIDLTERSAVINGVTSIESEAGAQVQRPAEALSSVQRVETRKRELPGASLHAPSEARSAAEAGALAQPDTATQPDTAAQLDTAARVAGQSNATGEVIFDLTVSGEALVTERGMLGIALR